MSRRTFVLLIALGIVLLVVGLLTGIGALAYLGLLGAVLVGAVWAFAAAGDFVRDVSARRFTRDGRS